MSPSDLRRTPLFAIFPKNERFAVFELNDVFAASVFSVMPVHAPH